MGDNIMKKYIALVVIIGGLFILSGCNKMVTSGKQSVAQKSKEDKVEAFLQGSMEKYGKSSDIERLNNSPRAKEIRDGVAVILDNEIKGPLSASKNSPISKNELVKLVRETEILMRQTNRTFSHELDLFNSYYLSLSPLSKEDVLKVTDIYLEGLVKIVSYKIKQNFNSFDNYIKTLRATVERLEKQKQKLIDAHEQNDLKSYIDSLKVFITSLSFVDTQLMLIGMG